MEQKKNTTRPSVKIGLGGILLRAALILLCLVLLSVHLMGSLFAKYSTSADGSDSARVAKFDVQATGIPSEAINVTCTNYNGDTGTYTFTVSNNSEVAVKYSVLLEYSEASYLTPSFNEDSVDQTTPDTSHIKFSKATWNLAPGATSDPHSLVFTVDWDSFTSGATGSSKDATINFVVTVIVEQVD